jgi:hypothetical protein
MSLTPTKNTVIGVFENPGADDVFQIKGPNGATQVWMDSKGILNAPIPIVPTIVTTTISAAQLKSLIEAPVLLAPAPGVGFFIAPQVLSVLWHDIDGALTPGNAFTFFAGWGTSVSANKFAQTNQNGLIDQTQDEFINVACTFSSPVAGSIVENAPVYFGSSGTDISGTPTQSHLHVTLTYTVLPS